MSSFNAKTKNYLILILLILLVISLWVGTYFMLKDDSSRGTFGDMFGAVNALFSGLAFVGLIYALTLQRKELEYQRLQLNVQTNELKQNTAELKSAAQAQDKSQKALNDQLANMQQTSKLNILNKYYDIYKGDSSKAPKVYAAKKIIEYHTEKMFFDKEHEYVTKPFFDCISNQEQTRVYFDEKLKNIFEFVCILKNTGAPCTFFGCGSTLFETDHIHYTTDLPTIINHGEKIPIQFGTDSSEENRINLTFYDDLSNTHWGQTITINKINALHKQIKSSPIFKIKSPKA